MCIVCNVGLSGDFLKYAGATAASSRLMASGIPPTPVRAQSATPTGTADVIFRGGPILTMNEGAPRAEALNNGRCFKRNRKFVDSPLQEDGFELLVPRHESPGLSDALRLITLTFGPLPRWASSPLAPPCCRSGGLGCGLCFPLPPPRDGQQEGPAAMGRRLVGLLRAAATRFEPDAFRVRLRFQGDHEIDHGWPGGNPLG
jgi:hypothetical protein